MWIWWWECIHVSRSFLRQQFLICNAYRVGCHHHHHLFWCLTLNKNETQCAWLDWYVDFFAGVYLVNLFQIVWIWQNLLFTSRYRDHPKNICKIICIQVFPNATIPTSWIYPWISAERNLKTVINDDDTYVYDMIAIIIIIIIVNFMIIIAMIVTIFGNVGVVWLRLRRQNPPF